MSDQRAILSSVFKRNNTMAYKLRGYFRKILLLVFKRAEEAELLEKKIIFIGWAQTLEV